MPQPKPKMPRILVHMTLFFWFAEFDPKYQYGQDMVGKGHTREAAIWDLEAQWYAKYGWS